jgi:hypothetical protein
VNGTCHCLTGYTGSKCDEKCPQGYYGLKCSKKCSCPENEVCDHVTGNCTHTHNHVTTVTEIKISHSVIYNNESTESSETAVPPPLKFSEIDHLKLLYIIIIIILSVIIISLLIYTIFGKNHQNNQGEQCLQFY